MSSPTRSDPEKVAYLGEEKGVSDPETSAYHNNGEVAVGAVEDFGEKKELR